MADRDTPEADVAEQEKSAASASADGFAEVPDDLGEQPEADVLEQALPVEEDQILSPAGSRAEASDADWIEQSIEVPLDEDEEER